jgi:adenylate cyclase class 2
MYEVEVKAVLKDRDAVMKKLQDLGCKFGGELHQIDRVFIPEGIVFPPSIDSGVGVLRVRKSNEKYIFTLKVQQGSRQDAIERELEILDGDKMVEILKILKYQEVPTVDKRRIKTNYKDMEIVLDVVENLGEFIEAEKIVTHEDKEARRNVQEELFAFLETLGVKKEDQVIDGKYDIMLYEKLKNK